MNDLQVVGVKAFGRSIAEPPTVAWLLRRQHSHLWELTFTGKMSVANGWPICQILLFLSGDFYPLTTQRTSRVCGSLIRLVIRFLISFRFRSLFGSSRD